MTEALENFHFLRPWALLLWPVAWLLLWRYQHQQGASAWAKHFDPELLRALNQQESKQHSSRQIGLYLAFLLAALAAAGPSWELQSQPVYRAPDHRVLVMDLSQSMKAADLKPSRLLRAKIAAAELLEADSEGDTGLVSFAGSAFTVSPLSADKQTVLHLLNSLDPELMPIQGGEVGQGIEQAVALLENTQSARGDIILFTDSAPGRSGLAAAQSARQKGYRVHVVAIGTDAGAPIPAPNGGWIKNKQGGIVLAKLDIAELRELAQSGGGLFQHLQIGPVQSIQSQWQQWDEENQDDFDAQAELWQDAGIWLLLPLLLLMPLFFRRGLIYVVFIGLNLSWISDSYAESAWLNSEQQAYEKFQKDDFSGAVEQFKNKDWKASSLYRQGQYEEAAKLWSEQNHAQAHYNRGNALAKNGDLEGAIAAYDQALQQQADFPAALDNKGLVEELLKQQEQQNQQGESGEQSEKNQGDQQEQEQNGQNSDSQQGDEADEPQSQAGEEGEQNQQASSQDGSSSQQDETGDQQEQQSAESSDGQQAEQQESQSAQAEDESTEGEETTSANLAEQGESQDEQSMAVQQWLNRIEDDPGGLLRRKFSRQQERRDPRQQESNAW